MFQRNTKSLWTNNTKRALSYKMIIDLRKCMVSSISQFENLSPMIRDANGSRLVWNLLVPAPVMLTMVDFDSGFDLLYGSDFDSKTYHIVSVPISEPTRRRRELPSKGKGYGCVRSPWDFAGFELKIKDREIAGAIVGRASMWSTRSSLFLQVLCQRQPIFVEEDKLGKVEIVYQSDGTSGEGRV